MKLRDQLNQMQTMMEQLVKMVGHNNAVTEELVQRVDSLEVKVDRLEVKVDKLEARVEKLETKVERLENRVNTFEKDTDKGFSDIIQMITVLGEKIDKIGTTQTLHSEMIRTLAADSAQHEAEITLLKQAKVS